MIKLPAIFKNHAVFQRDKVFRIWGVSDTSITKISVIDETDTVINEAIVTDADVCDDGHFMVEMSPLEAGGPYVLRIENESEVIELEDVYFGDVWLAGGQSNMEFMLKNSKYASEEIQELEVKANDRIRFYNVPQIAWLGPELEQAEENSNWQLCNADNAGEWSAVAYYFAKALTEESDGIMIGVVGCNWGGTSASCWMSREKLLEHRVTAQYVDTYDSLVEGICEEEYQKAYEEYVIYQAEFDKNVGYYYQTSSNPTWDEAISLFGENKYPGPMGPKNWTRPYGLYETMLKRIVPYGLMGCIFYQGEEDDNRPYSYKRLLTSLIEQWRADFLDVKLAFITVQLPIFVNEGEADYKNWPFIREAQAVVAEETGNGLAVILEAGEYHNIHPLNKETVGYRLAFQALYRVYGCYSKWEACGPEYDSSFVNGDALYVDLKCCDSGLMVNGDDGFIEDVHMMDFLPTDSGFEIAGEDGIYYNARAQVMRGENVSEDPVESDFSEETDLFGNQAFADELNNPIYDDNVDQTASSLGSILTIKLTSENVDKPKYARYFWKNYGKVRVFGANGIPLAPFRTDTNDGAKALGSRLGDIIDVI